MYDDEDDYWEFVESVRRAIVDESGSESVPPPHECRLEVRGSLGRGELRPPYSDIDLLLVAPPGMGRRLRDVVPEIAAASGELLAVFVDPFSPEGTFCSIFAGPLKVDWFIGEEIDGGIPRTPPW